MSGAAQDRYTKFVARVLFPLHEWAKGHTTAGVRAALERSQWWSRERLAAWQIERLRAFLTAAGARVPYYRTLFAAHGFDPRAVATLADLARLPLLDKRTIRAHFDEFKAVDARALARFNTGGSSGEPLIFCIGKERVSHDVAAKWRAMRWWGVDIGDPEVVVWGSPIELGAQDRLRGIRDRLLRTRLLSAFEMSAANVARFAAEIRALRPKMLFGYPSALALIARCAARDGARMDNLGIRVAFVTAERLYDDQRRDIARIFACPVANGYGGRDAGFIAHECPAGGMHITAEDIVVEIVDEQGRIVPQGEAGEIVVTHLATADFPFIRYRTGDVAALGVQECRCGRGLPLLHDLQGRSTDFLTARDGTVLHGLALIYVLRDLPGIENFKITQESLAHTRIQIVTGPEFRESDIAVITRGVQQRLGEEVAVTVEKVERIAAERSGKYRYVVSHVQRPAAPG